MKKINLIFLFPILCLFLLVYALSNQLFTVPPLGKLLNPFIGAIQNENEHDSPLIVQSGLGLKDTVRIYFDRRRVPHIYARNKHDLYFAQGYVTAYLRLWQMDFLSYASAGRLSEIFTDGFLDYDRNQRHLGILTGAKETLKFINKDRNTAEVLSDYTRGINAYVEHLSYKDMPLEYKILHYQPEKWTELKSILIMKYIGTTLSGYEQDISMTNLMLLLGEKDFNKYFPSLGKSISPLVNYSSKLLNPSLSFTKKPQYLNYSFLNKNTVLDSTTYNSHLGSNSWVVSGRKTKSGSPILCSDPHLGLTLPAIWLEMQLNCPNLNVYGVSIPGTPAIIIGFNERIAWGLTNGADDVRDWYKLKLSADYKQYFFDGKWIGLTKKIEKIRRRGYSDLLDTVYYSIHGPIVYDHHFSNKKSESNDYALSWELNNPSNEFKCFIELNEAGNFTDYQNAIAEYSCPSQNFTFACVDNTIAANHQGKLHYKWNDQGKFILDGSESFYRYSRYIPQDSLPHAVNPDCGFIISANQHPTSAKYPYYYNGYFLENRAKRIEELLIRDDKLDVPTMMDIQLDNTSVFARNAIKELLKHVKKVPQSSQSKLILNGLSTWRGEYGLQDTSAVFFEAWWLRINQNTWDEFKNYSFQTPAPNNDVLMELVKNEPNNKYFDLLNTTKVENADDIINLSYMQALQDFDKLKAKGMISWGDYHRVSLLHMSKLIPLSKMGLKSAGNPEAINAMGNNWGPSWRMIVELGKRPKAFGIFPGGESGNPAGKNYDSFVNDWNLGKYYHLDFYMSMQEAKYSSVFTWKIK